MDTSMDEEPSERDKNMETSMDAEHSDAYHTIDTSMDEEPSGRDKNMDTSMDAEHSDGYQTIDASMDGPHSDGDTTPQQPDAMPTQQGVSMDGEHSEGDTTPHQPDALPAQHGVVMERKVGLLGGVSLVMGIVIGSGIFISPKGVVVATNSEAFSLLIWGICGIITLFGALGQAELACIIPMSFGSYNYLRITYTRWLGFLFGWNAMIVRPVSVAISALTCAEYILTAVFNDGCGNPPDLYERLLAMFIVLLFCASNCWSVRLSSGINIVFTFAKSAALVIIIIGGIVRLAQGHYQNLATGFENSNTNAGEIILGFYSAMYAYDGWQGLSTIVEEIINPKRNIPLTYIIAMPLITFFYLMANISYFTVMNAGELLQSNAVAITWMEDVLPKAFWLMPMFVAMSTFGSTNGGLFSSGRLFYVMGREDEMPKVLSFIHHKRHTPMPSVIVSTMFAVIYIWAGEVIQLINFLSFTNWLFTGLIQLAIIILRVRWKDKERVFKVPLVFPVIVVCFSIIAVIVPLIDALSMNHLYASLVLLAGLIFYIPIVHFNNRAGCMRYITQFFQLLMQIVPAIVAEDDYKTK